MFRGGCGWGEGAKVASTGPGLGLCAEAGGDPSLHGISLAAVIHIDCVGHLLGVGRPL